MNGLPFASQSQIEEMNREANKKMLLEVEQDIEQEQEQEQEQVIESEVQSEEVSAVQELKLIKEENFKLLRQSKDKLQRELEEARALLAQRSAPKEEEQEESFDYNLNPDDLAEGKHFLSLKKELNSLKKAREEDAKRSMVATAEMRIKADFPDFDKVASYENQKKLRELDSDIADSILATGDMYKAHAMAYKMIKLLNIHRDTTYDQSKEIAQKNSLKPKSLNSLAPQKSDTPLSHANAFANGLTSELTKQLIAEMNEARRNL
jgi:hypothetical protein